jgi:signal transduction histidine kinase
MSHLTPEERIESYRRLLVISQVLTSTLDLFTLLDLIVNAARDLTRSEATSILLLDNKTGDLYFEAATGSKSEEIKRLVVPPDSLAGWVVREGRPQIINDVTRDQRFFSQSDKQTGFLTRSLIAVPLKVKDKVIGALEAINRMDDTPFEEEDIELMATLGAQAAVAITNARLFQQSDLISEMVHELRTPLTSIVAYSELMLRREIPPAQARGFIDTIYQESMHLSSMTNGFLELSRLQSGRIRMDMVNFNLTDLIREVLQLLQPQTGERGLTLSATLPDQPVFVNADRERIRQVLVNLTSNAIKYNRDGGVVNLLVEPTNAEHVHVSVSDTGRGIPEKDLPRIFEKFFRVADSEGYATGTGLGLSIVRQIIEAHGSDIEVQSQVDVGTTFSFVLKAASEAESR